MALPVVIDCFSGYYLAATFDHFAIFIVQKPSHTYALLGCHFGRHNRNTYLRITFTDNERRENTENMQDEFEERSKRVVQ